MADFKYDLHMHTTTSDGKLRWKDLLEHVKASGLEGISITNHNTLGPVSAIAEEAARLGLRFIPGVEIKITCKRQIEAYKAKTASNAVLLPTQELLIYGIDPENGEFRQMSASHLEGKKKYVAELCRLLRDHSTAEIPGMTVDVPVEVDAAGVIAKAGTYVGATHVLEAIIEKYQKNSALGKLTKNDVKKLVVDVQADALKVMQDDPFYGLDIVEGLRKAKAWGNTVVSFAHPFTGSRGEMAMFYQDFLMPLLAGEGLNGIEFSYPEHTEEHHRIIRSMAEQHGLILTGGSDFHRKEDKLYRLGSAGVDKETFDELERRTK